MHVQYVLVIDDSLNINKQQVSGSINIIIYFTSLIPNKYQFLPMSLYLKCVQCISTYCISYTDILLRDSIRNNDQKVRIFIFTAS